MRFKSITWWFWIRRIVYVRRIDYGVKVGRGIFNCNRVVDQSRIQVACYGFYLMSVDFDKETHASAQAIIRQT